MLKKIYAIIASFIVRFRWPIIIGSCLLVIGFSLCMLKFDFESDMTLWVDKNSPQGKLPYYINETFGSNSPLLIAIETEDVFSKENLEALMTFSEEIKNLAGVKNVYSLATADEILPTAYGLKIEKLIPRPLPQDEEELLKLKAKILAEKKYTGRLVAEDGKATLVAISLAFKGRNDLLARTIKQKAISYFGPKAKLYYSGNTFLLNAISDIVISDIAFLVPLVSLLVILVLFISFRSLRGVFLPLLTVLFATALTMGLMAALHVPLNVLSSAVPVILIAIGSAYGIHVLNNYYEQVKEYKIENKEEVVKGIISQVGLPVLMAGLTTIVGFISNLTSEVSIIKTFGIFTALGVGLAVIISLFFLPALLVLLPLPKVRAAKPKNDRLLFYKEKQIFSQKFAALLFRFRFLVLGFFIVLTVFASVFATKITSKVDILSYFSEKTEARRSSDFISQKFGGFNPLSLYIKGDVLEPAALKFQLIFDEMLKASGQISQPVGLAEIITELNYALSGLGTIPENRAEVENLLFFIEGNPMLDTILTKSKTESLTTVLLPSMDNNYLDKVFNDCDSYLAAFKEGIELIKNDYSSEEFSKIASLFLKNFLASEKVECSSKRLNEILTKLIKAKQALPNRLDYKRLYAYALSDEAEIILEEKEAEKLISKIVQYDLIDEELLKQILIESLIYPEDFKEDELKAFSHSLRQIIKETIASAQIINLKQILEEEFPSLRQSSENRKSYALSPFFWETIPVGSELAAAEAPKIVLEEMQITGTAKLVEEIRKSIFGNQLLSILIALVSVLILNSLTFRSFKEGLISLLPILFTIIINFGVMGVFGIPLDFVTAIIAGAAIGTGIDYTIHFVSRYNSERKKTNQLNKVLARTFSTTGKAIIFNAISVAAGFAVLLFSNVVPLRTAGLLLASTMLSSSLAALAFMPLILVMTQSLSLLKIKEIRARLFNKKEKKPLIITPKIDRQEN